MLNNISAKKFPVTNAPNRIYSALLSPNSAATGPYGDTVQSACFSVKKADSIVARVEQSAVTNSSYKAPAA